jgi:large subunit ribosomal protein L6
MSRIGKSPITIPAGVTVDVKQGGDFGHQIVTVTGPKGSLSRSLRHSINVEVKDGIVNLTRDNEENQTRAFHGLYRSLIQNMITGVTEGYRKDLEIQGIGYRAEMQGDKMVLSLGYAHKIEYRPPQGITVNVKDQVEISIEGIDNQLVGEVAAKIRAFRKPEPYKGKGVRYKNEQVRRKSVKKGA